MGVYRLLKNQNFKKLESSQKLENQNINVQNNADKTIVPTFTNFEAFLQEERSTFKALAFAS